MRHHQSTECVIDPAISRNKRTIVNWDYAHRRSEFVINGGSRLTLWRQVPSVQELPPISTIRLLWCRATKVSPTSTFRKILDLPAELIERCLKIYFHSCNKIGNNEHSAPCQIVSNLPGNILKGFG